MPLHVIQTGAPANTIDNVSAAHTPAADSTTGPQFVAPPCLGTGFDNGSLTECNSMCPTWVTALSGIGFASSRKSVSTTLLLEGGGGARYSAACDRNCFEHFHKPLLYVQG